MQDFKSLVKKLTLTDFIATFTTYFSRRFEPEDSLHYVLTVQDYKKMQNMIRALESMQEIKLQISKLPSIKILDNDILRLQKRGILALEHIYEFMKILNFFYDLSRVKNLKNEFVKNYIDNFNFPNKLLDLLALFAFKKGENILKPSADSKLESLYIALDSKKKQKESDLFLIMRKDEIKEYLVDSNIHFIDNQGSILVRPGYSNFLSAKVIGRSQHGFFYIIPLSIEKLQSQIYILEDKIQERLYALSVRFSQILYDHISFLKFINDEYDFIDSANARVDFAKDYGLEFVFASPNTTGDIKEAGLKKELESKNYQARYLNYYTLNSEVHLQQLDSITLHEYSHPSLKNPVPLSISMNKKILMITGVNVGGKTMLLKSILSAALCSRHLVPMKINATKSHIPLIQNIEIIAQDPQDSTNDISTFSGRIVEIARFLNKAQWHKAGLHSAAQQNHFSETKEVKSHKQDSRFFQTDESISQAMLESNSYAPAYHLQMPQMFIEDSLLLGIDEIEIGTDSAEAACLYRAILEYLQGTDTWQDSAKQNKIYKNVKIIITTHHKSLVALMADNKSVMLRAATYDYKRAIPTFNFIEGIGKSYALECAEKYGIPTHIIARARQYYGEDANRLEKLIETSNYQITKNKQKEQELQNLVDQNKAKSRELDAMKVALKQEFDEKSLELKRHYNESVKELKMLVKKVEANSKMTKTDGFNLTGEHKSVVFKKDENIESKKQDSKKHHRKNTNSESTQENITKYIHKTLNKSHKREQNVPKICVESARAFYVDELVIYRGQRARVLETCKNGYVIELIQNNLRLKGVKSLDLEPLDSKKPLESLRTDSKIRTTMKAKFHIDMEVKANVSLDLHGMTQDEAMESLRTFFSNALVAKFSEVEIVHGIGSGVLKRLVENYLDSQPFVRGYNGDLAKKIVYLC